MNHGKDEESVNCIVEPLHTTTLWVSIKGIASAPIHICIDIQTSSCEMGVNEQKWKQNWNVIWNISRKKVVKPEIFRPSIVFLQEQHRVMFSCHWTCRKLLTLSLRRVHVNGRIIELHWYKYRIDSSAVILEWITFVSSGKSTETWSWKKAAVLCSHMRSHGRKRREKAFCNIEQTNNVLLQSVTCLLSLVHNIYHCDVCVGTTSSSPIPHLNWKYMRSAYHGSAKASTATSTCSHFPLFCSCCASLLTFNPIVVSSTHAFNGAAWVKESCWVFYDFVYIIRRRFFTSEDFWRSSD